MKTAPMVLGAFFIEGIKGPGSGGAVQQRGDGPGHQLSGAMAANGSGGAVQQRGDGPGHQLAAVEHCSNEHRSSLVR